MSSSISLPKSITRNFESYLTYVNSLPTLSYEEEVSLFRRFQDNNDLNAVHQIILAHLRFVASVAFSFRGYGLPMEDIVQEGTIGLMKAVKKFELSFGTRLSGFAKHFIKAEIQDYVIKNWRLVKATTTKAKRKLFFNLRRLKQGSNWLTEPEIKTIAAELSVNRKDVVDMEVQLTQSDFLLDSSAQSNDEQSMLAVESLLEDTSGSFERIIEKNDFNQKASLEIKQVVETLDERSKDIFISRWLSEEKKTQQFLAEKYGISGERVRQIEEKVLQKIRKRFCKFDESSK